MIRYNSIDVYSFKRYRLELLSNQRPTPKRQSFHIYGEGFVCSSNTDTGAGRELACWPAGYLREDWGATVRAARLVAGWP